MSKKVRNLLLAMLVQVPAVVLADPTGQALAFTCAGCHGTDGSSVGPSSPSIAAMDPEVFIDAMQAYKRDERNSTIMNRIAKGYRDEQIKGMAWYFAKQKMAPAPQAFDPKLAEAGAKLHEKYCEKCHEKGGRPGDAGTLAGQWMPYLNFTMEDFMSGHRDYPRKMKRKVDAAVEAGGDEALRALLHYYASKQ
ncbi:MAG: cytochrome c4 [Gammaproteobacteria bacterium]|nr:cytochrome c4 [Gammaproteobacteria bacterium]MBU1655978.1 cytochrome c4 [Gammaproteobacteria bacterium]MBU1962562.1 cytochrome c4 [Gammaproteobacteria bacterium]